MIRSTQNDQLLQYSTGWGGHLFRRLCNLFSKSSPCLLGQNCSCSKAKRPMELSENSLQNLRNKWPPHPIYYLIYFLKHFKVTHSSGRHLLANLGWVDFDFGCSPLCMVLPGLILNWLSSWARWCEHPRSKSTQPRFARRWATLYVVYENTKLHYRFPTIYQGGYQGLSTQACPLGGLSPQVPATE